VTVIVILAMVAAFLAMRLYSVLGKRTGHEQQPAPTPDDRAKLALVPLRPAEPTGSEPVRAVGDGLIDLEAEAGVRAIIAADRSFDVPQFVEGAKGAYRMILEAFWAGDREQLGWLCDSNVLASFEEAILAREAEGHILENRLIRIEKVQISEAGVSGKVAHIQLRFDADIAAVTRDKDGTVVAGSMTDGVDTHDVWTFSRDLTSSDPNWKLSETDEV
jgi:predicted lipid-binding transport protein (Tim44 family)